MNPVKITILGDFWDCQIYMGRLYLWGLDNSLKILDWNKLVNSLISEPRNKLALSCAFTDGDYLYNREFETIFHDEDFKKLLETKFLEASSKDFYIDDKAIQKFQIACEDSPIKELPSDTEFLTNRIYGVIDEGLFSFEANKTKKKFGKLQKHWDCPVLSMAANKYAQISLSAGNEGLFEFNAAKFDLVESMLGMSDKRIQQISKKHSTFSDYQFLSIYSSSNVHQSYLSLFKWVEKKIDPLVDASTEYERERGRDISVEEIFGKNERGISWGSNEKIYQATDDGMNIVHFNNYAKEDNQLFYNYKKVPFQPWKGKILAGAVAYFGTVIECENAIAVMLSDGTFYNIHGQATRWRVYPRSIKYENHLHVIFEDRMEIYSFNQDYFQDQKSKDFGFSYQHKKGNNSNYSQYL
jgi:hypothetical protein